MSEYYKKTTITDAMVGKALDPALYCHVHNVPSMGLQAIKKISHGGQRGTKSKITDYKQAIAAIEKLIELEEMDADEVAEDMAADIGLLPAHLRSKNV